MDVLLPQLTITTLGPHHPFTPLIGKPPYHADKDLVTLGVIPSPKHHNEGLFTSYLLTLGILPGPKHHHESLIGPLSINHMNGLLALPNMDFLTFHQSLGPTILLALSMIR